jgi:hypothetical protein
MLEPVLRKLTRKRLNQDPPSAATGLPGSGIDTLAGSGGGSLPPDFLRKFSMEGQKG